MYVMDWLATVVSAAGGEISCRLVESSRALGAVPRFWAPNMIGIIPYPKQDFKDTRSRSLANISIRSCPKPKILDETRKSCHINR